MLNLIVSPFSIKDINRMKNAGATSILVGCDVFSVRSVTSFNQTECQEVRKLCTQDGLLMYVLVNAFVSEDELPKLKKHLMFLKQLQVDGIYFNDLSVLHEAQLLEMKHLLIYNPDTLLTNASDVKAYFSFGLQMCTLSKEITLDDMIGIANQVQQPLEMVIHGRIPLMHSKRYLLRNYFEFIDANQKDSQASGFHIREEQREEHMPLFEDASGTHIYSGFTLCGFQVIKRAMDAGIQNFRMESLFEDVDHVCQLLEDYSKVLQDSSLAELYYNKYEKTYPEKNMATGFFFQKTEVKR